MIGAPASARSPTTSSILWRTHSSAKSLPLRIDRGARVKDERIVEIGAERQTFTPQPLGVAQESEAASSGQFAPERLGRQIKRQALAADWTGKGDFHIQMEAGFCRPQLRPAGPVGYARRIDDAQHTPRRSKRHDAGLVDRRDEVSGRAVHRWNLVAFEQNQRIVDAKRRKRGHHMLDRRHARAVAGELCAQCRCIDARPMRFDIGSGDAENDPNVSAGRRERHAGGTTAMHALAG